MPVDLPLDRRQCAAFMPLALLRYLARAVGEVEAERARADAGEHRTIEELDERGLWVALESTAAIADRIGQLTGDHHPGCRGGEELMRWHVVTGVADFYRAEGSVTAALEQIVIPAASRVTTGLRMAVIDRADGGLLVEGRYDDPVTSTLLCDFASGYFASVAALFGANGYAVDLECQARGDERCLKQIRWFAGADAPDLSGADDRRTQMLVRYEHLQSLAADLAAADDVAGVLDLVVERAGNATLARRFLLAVRLDGETGLRVHHSGFASEDEARHAAKVVLTATPTPSTLVVEVASSSLHYGCIAAFYPEGTECSDIDRRHLSAYASHAAAALQAAAAFEHAQRDRDIAKALLDFAGTLAQVGTIAEVAVRVVDAVPRVTGAIGAAVWLCPPGALRLELSACNPPADSANLPATLTVDEVSGLADLIHSPHPVVLDVETESGALHEAMCAIGAVQVVAAPVVARSTFLGLVSSSFSRALADGERERVVEVLTGLADQAAVALDNSRLVEEIRRRATHDALTGLANRTLVEDRANQAMGQPRLRPVGLLFIDLDRFKNVNDTLGHRAGDDLLRLAATRLENLLRVGDTLARVGGDEFVILLPEVDDGRVAADVAARVVAAFSMPFVLDGHQIFISCSVGVVVSLCGGADYETLVAHADLAMYEAKTRGGKSFVVHAPARIGKRHPTLEVENALHHAIANRELGVAYQPQVELGSGRIVGVEALVRWHHPTLGGIDPSEFIPIAEASGLIVPIDRWVRRTALAQARTWREAGLAPLRVAINVSTRELRDPCLADEVAADMREMDMPPELLEIEITERVAMGDDEDLLAILCGLRRTGVRLAIDDFGTGTSVLGRLQRLPVNTLKIDSSFIDEVGTDAAGVIVGALIQMGADLGMEVVAEGVETEAQRLALATMGCPFVQGFLFSRPVPAAAMGRLLRRGRLEPRLLLELNASV